MARFKTTHASARYVVEIEGGALIPDRTTCMLRPTRAEVTMRAGQVTEVAITGPLQARSHSRIQTSADEPAETHDSGLMGVYSWYPNEAEPPAVVTDLIAHVRALAGFPVLDAHVR